MAYCENCGQQLNGSAKFCSSCGSPNNNVLNESPTQRQTIYEGIIHKCPNCSETLSAFSVICPSCGFELRERKVTRSIHSFSTKMNEINTSSITEILTDAFGGTSERISLIRNFPIPNTKEDIYEFLILALSNIETDAFGFGGSTSQMNISNAWIAKYEQAYQKALISFGNSDQLGFFKDEFDKKCKQIKKKKRQLPTILILVFGLSIIVSFVILFFTGVL